MEDFVSSSSGIFFYHVQQLVSDKSLMTTQKRRRRRRKLFFFKIFFTNDQMTKPLSQFFFSIFYFYWIRWWKKEDLNWLIDRQKKRRIISSHGIDRLKMMRKQRVFSSHLHHRTDRNQRTKQKNESNSKSSKSFRGSSLFLPWRTKTNRMSSCSYWQIENVRWTIWMCEKCDQCRFSSVEHQLKKETENIIDEISLEKRIIRDQRFTSNFTSSTLKNLCRMFFHGFIRVFVFV